MIFLLTHKGIIGIREIEAFISINTIMWCWTEKKNNKKKLRIQQKEFYISDRKQVDSQFLEIMITEGVPRCLLKR